MTRQAKSPAAGAPSPEASRRAVAILEVLAGQRTASEAATAVGISLNHYYLLERKALAALTAACEVQPKGPRGPGLEKQLEELKRELEQCRGECLRQAALVRAAQRAVGLPAASGKPAARGGNGKAPKKRRRKPQVRALRAAERAKDRAEEQAGEPPEKNCSRPKTGDGVSPTEAGPAPASPPRRLKERSDDSQG